MRKLCRIVAFDPDEGQVIMDLFAELSERDLDRTSMFLEKLVVKGFLRGYRAEISREVRQLQVQILLMPAVKAEIDDLERLMKRRESLGMGAHRGGPKDWSPIDEVTAHIAEEIARAFFVTAWADAQEERGTSFSGVNLYDVAPETPEYVIRDAMDLVRSMERLNGMRMRDMYYRALDRAELIDAPDVRDNFGYMTAMQAMGSGVRWTDDYRDHGLKVPYKDFTQFDLKEEDREREGS